MKNKSFIFALSLFAASVAITPLVQAEPPVAASPAPSVQPTDKPARMKPIDRINQRVAELTTELSLTPDQQKKITDILSADMEDAKADRSNAANLTPEDRKAKRKAMMEKSHGQIRAVLTPDQQAKFDTMKMHRRGQGAPAVPPPAAAAPAAQ